MTLKRTQYIHRETFRKSWRTYQVAPVALAIGAACMLSACEKTDETVFLYQNADDCSQANPGRSEQCTTTYNNALKEAERTAPKYATQEDCSAEFGETQCTQTQIPQMGQISTASEQTAQQNGSLWMPLMAGYMMGRMMSNGAGFSQQPLFTSTSASSPTRGKFVDASGKNYGPVTSGRTITVPKNAMAPKPTITKTITRGGFGESVTRAMQHGNNTRATQSGSRRLSAGG